MEPRSGSDARAGAGAAQPSAHTAARDERGLRGIVPFRFACHRCARCCSAGAGHVWVEDDECRALAQALGMSVEAFVARYVRRVSDPRDGRARLALREEHRETSGERGGRCALLVGLNECSAYSARPRHCREFPYWTSVLGERAAFESARETCPGIAVVVDDKTRERAHAALAALYAEVGGATERGGCCLALERDEGVFATALEADFALAARSRASSAECGCQFGAGAPLACRAGSDPERFEALFARLRAIERECGYPAAYGRLRELLQSRGFTFESSRGASNAETNS